MVISVGSMYFVMKSFWYAVTRGGRALPAHSVTPLVSKLPLASATRTRDAGWPARFASAPRSEIRPRWYMYRAPAPASPSAILLPPSRASPPSGLIALLLRLTTADVPFGLV